MGEIRVALVHDELTRRGGAEIVLEELIRLFPQADIFSLYAGRPQMTVDGRRYPIHTSFLQKFPVWWRRHPKRLLPLLPYAAEQFDFSTYDVVVSSASGFIKGLVTRTNIPHICYCHTPPRYIWEDATDSIRHSPRGTRWLGRLLVHWLRVVDFTAAQRIDRLVANSAYTQARIRSYYRRPSDIIYPPVDTTFFTPQRRRDFAGKNVSWEHPFLLVGRLTPMKRFDTAIRVCEKLHLPLVVVGRGHAERDLRAVAGKHTRFVGNVDRETLRDYYRRASALLQPGVEDFGVASVEALACGTPVIAYGYGGVREIIDTRALGYLYPEGRDEALAEALRQFMTDKRSFSPEILQQAARRFDTTRFTDAIYRLVVSTVELKQTT